MTSSWDAKDLRQAVERGDLLALAHAGYMDYKDADYIRSFVQSYEPLDPDDPKKATETERYERLVRTAATRELNRAVASGNTGRLAYAAGHQGDESIDMGSFRAIDELESLWEDYPTFQAYIYGPLPPEGPTGMGKTDFAYLMVEIGRRVFPDLSVASNNATDEFQTLKRWTEVRDWLESTDGRTVYIMDEAPQVLQFADMDEGLALSKFLKLLRKYSGNAILIGQTGKDVALDVRRQLLMVRKQDKTTATVGVGTEEDDDGEIQIKKEMFTISNVPATSIEYDTYDEGEFVFDNDDEESEYETPDRCYGVNKDGERCGTTHRIGEHGYCKRHRDQWREDEPPAYQREENKGGSSDSEE